MLYATALESGSVTVATAAVVLAETAPPALIGILFLGDHTRPGLAPLAAVAFVLAVTCAVLLARFGEAGENAGGAAASMRRPDAGPGRRAEHLDGVVRLWADGWLTAVSDLRWS